MLTKMKMRKIYLTAIIASLCNFAMSQGFFVPTTYRGAFAPAPTVPWTDQWTNWDPQNAVYPSSTDIVSTNITNNTTWTSNKVYLLQGQIYVKNGAILTIEPGTVILGDKFSTGAALIITQGSQIIANGTPSNPIVFTSNQIPGARSIGDWGGLIILGRGANNKSGGIANVEGLAVGADTQFGGGLNPVNTDNSGSLKYVRIEFPGFVYAPNQEINGLTLGAVGSGTVIDHIQVSYSNDDAFEWFGGAVNCRNLVSYRNLDDDFDTDNGFSGNIQFGLVVRDPNSADLPSVSTSEGFESDNDGTGSVATPQTNAIFSNITLVGPFRGNVSAFIAAGYRRGARIRRNSALRIYNSIFMDFQRGIHIDGTPCEVNATSDLLKFRNNIVAGYTPKKEIEINSGSIFDIKTWFVTSLNDSVASSANILVTPYNYTAPDYRPAANSIALTNYSFNDAVISPVVLAAPLATLNYQYCINEPATILSATATPGNTLKWYDLLEGGTPISTPTPSTVTAGTFKYYVCQVGIQGIEGTRTEISVTVHNKPTAPSVDVSGPTSFCTGGSVTLTSSQSSGNVWNNLSNSTTAAITVNSTGSYAVTYTDVNGCSSTSVAISVNVGSAPIPTVLASGPLTFCEGDSVILVSSSGDTYLWNDNSINDSLIVYTPGLYSVTTTNSDLCLGVGQSENLQITVNPVPLANASYTSSGNVVTFSSTGSAGATSYSWDFGDGSNSNQASPLHAYAANDSYSVTLTAISGDCTDEYTFNVLINVGLEEISLIEHISLFPNPAKEEATLVLDIKENSFVDVVIFDFSGKEVLNVFNGSVYSGKTEFKINTTDLSNGMYYAKISTDTVVETIKMIISK